MNRDRQIALYLHTRAVERARDEYAAHPTACAHWCVGCVWPVGTTKDCDNCKANRRMRRLQEARR